MTDAILERERGAHDPLVPVSVLYASHSSVVSGAELSLLELLQALPTEISAAVAAPRGRLLDDADALGVPTYALARSEAGLHLHALHTPAQLVKLVWSAALLRRRASAWGARIVHANSIRAALGAALLMPRSTKLVVHVRDWLPESVTAVAVRRAVLARADAVIANSKYTLDNFFLNLPTAATGLAIPNPVDLNRFSPATPAATANGAPYALTLIAQITPWKAHDDAIRTLSILRRRGVDCSLRIVGEPLFLGPQRSFDNERYARALDQLLTRLELRDHVHFLGWRNDVAGLIRESDVVLLPSWREPFGRAAAEAMACGKPVVATSIGGTAELVRHGVDGLLLAPRAPQRWAVEIEELLLDPERRRAMGAAGYARAREILAPSAHAAAVADVYESILTPRVSHPHWMS